MSDILLPRGIRNNNPGNIRLGPVRWQGQRPVQTDPSFVEFDSPEMGLRALMRVLLTYYHKYGLDTVESVINRWAPPHENATDSYIHHVARALGVRRRDKLDLRRPQTLLKLAQTITRHENGPPGKDRPPHWYADRDYKAALALALEGITINERKR